MLYSICIDDIHRGDDIKCTKCNEFLHFNCAGLREANFRKMSSTPKEKWYCSTCKTKKTAASPVFLPVKSSQIVNDDTLNSVVDSVNFLCSQFDDFNNQLKHLFSTINDLECENKRIIEENVFLKKETVNLSERIDELEQKTLECHIEILGVPEIKQFVQTLFKQLQPNWVLMLQLKKLIDYNQNFLINPEYYLCASTPWMKKIKFMEIAKTQKLVAKDLDSTWNGTAIYFNDKMTYTCRNLFFNARK